LEEMVLQPKPCHLAEFYLLRMTKNTCLDIVSNILYHVEQMVLHPQNKHSTPLGTLSY